MTVTCSFPAAPSAKIDARKQSVAEREERKEHVLRLHEQGMRVMEIVRTTGLNHGTVSRVIRAGLCVPSKSPGRKSGEGRALTIDQELLLRVFIRGRPTASPDIGGKTWTRDAVSHLFESKCNIPLSRRGVDGYLSRWGIGIEQSDQPPERRCVAAIRSWWLEHQTALRKEASNRRATIIWLNPTRTIDAQPWYVEDMPHRHTNLLLLSATTTSGTLHWKLFNAPMKPAHEIRFLQDLYFDLQRRLLLIRCKRPMYHRQEVLEFAGQSRGRYTLLPPRFDPMRVGSDVPLEEE